jgi:hypothetical protein
MPRPLSDAARAAIGRQSSRVHNLIYLDLADNQMFLAIDSAQDLEFQRTEGPIVDGSAQVWEGIGGAMVPGPAEESPDLDSGGQDLQVAAVDPDFQLGGILLESRPCNRDYQHWRLHYHDAGSLAGTVKASYLIFHGKLNGMFEIQDVNPEEVVGAEPGTILVKFRAMNPFGMLDVTRNIKTNLDSHQKHYAGDLFMTHVEATMNRRVYWGWANPDPPEE